MKGANARAEITKRPTENEAGSSSSSDSFITAILLPVKQKLKINNPNHCRLEESKPEIDLCVYRD